MQTFEYWLQQRTLEEGWGKNLLTTGLLGLGALGATGCGNCDRPAAVQQASNGVGYNNEGQIESKVTVTIHKSLGASKGIELASKQAIMKAKAQLVKWLHGEKKISGGYESSGKLSGVESRVVRNGDGTLTAICTIK